MGTNKATALGRTNGFGPVNAAKAISTFMGSGANSSSASTNKRGLLQNLAGGNKGGAAAGATGATSAGQKTAKGTTEGGVAKAAGTGATQGLPTTADDGTITMTFHQVNQDGAGPLTAQVDATSGGTDPAAFKDAQVTQNVPGIGIGGLSAATTTDFPVKVQMPAGMTCNANVGGASNVCVVRLQNSALAGPFGGSAAFTQSPAAKKRAIEYNLRKRHIARGLLGKLDEE
jgi:Egh16-like virulence factor